MLIIMTNRYVALRLLSFVYIFILCNCSSPKDGYEYVDLNLPSGNLWATSNVGASVPTEIGDFFAWAETSTKDDYSWDSYKYSVGDSIMLKYNLNRRMKSSDGQIFLSLKDDAATVNMSEAWTTPSLGDFIELLESCEWETVNDSISNVCGMDGISKYNGKKIFIPFSYSYTDTVLKQNNCILYWTSQLDYNWENYEKGSFRIRTNYNTAMTSQGYDLNRCYGLPIRAIIKGNRKSIALDSSFYKAHYLQYDKIEDSIEYISIISQVEKEVADFLKKNESLNASETSFYIYFEQKQKILKKYGIEWKTPVEENPTLFQFY